MPVTPDDLAGMRAWRMGPWRHRHERWDLLPVSCLGLDAAHSGALFLAGLYTAGSLAAALGKGRRPAVLKDPALRAAAGRAIAEVIEQTRPDREAIAAEVAELLEKAKEGKAS